MREKELKWLSHESMACSAALPSQNKALLQDAMWQWLIMNKKPSLKPRSFDRLVSTYNAHIKDTQLGRQEIRNIKREDIARHLCKQNEVIAFSTGKKIYELLKMFFENYFILCPNASPIIGVQKPTRRCEITLDEDGIANTGEMEVLSDDEIRLFISELHKERSQSYACNSYMLPFLHIKYASEILSLPLKQKKNPTQLQDGTTYGSLIIIPIIPIQSILNFHSPYKAVT